MAQCAAKKIGKHFLQFSPRYLVGLRLSFTLMQNFFLLYTGCPFKLAALQKQFYEYQTCKRSGPICFVPLLGVRFRLVLLYVYLGCAKSKRTNLSTLCFDKSLSDSPDIKGLFLLVFSYCMRHLQLRHYTWTRQLVQISDQAKEIRLSGGRTRFEIIIIPLILSQSTINVFSEITDF